VSIQINSLINKFSSIINAVKPVLRCHLLDKEKMTFQDR
jgi:hypothetical protein